MNTKLEELKAKVAEIQKEIEKLIKKEDSKYLDLSINENWRLGNEWKNCELTYFSIELREGGKYANRGFYLNEIVNWEVVKDDLGYLVLLPTKK